jgi:hypothetical protein
MTMDSRFNLIQKAASDLDVAFERFKAYDARSYRLRKMAALAAVFRKRGDAALVGDACGVNAARVRQYRFNYKKSGLVLDMVDFLNK